MDRGRKPVIRQAISCDICGTEMLNANHWFVAYDQGPDLRLSAWNARTRLRAGAKHLCGQTCLHKLVDEFMAEVLNVRTAPPASKPATDELRALSKAQHIDARLTTGAAHATQSRPTISAAYLDQKEEFESSARMLPSPIRASRTSRLEAWKREREREERAAEQRPTIAARRSIA